jgi:hypothetical protein
MSIYLSAPLSANRKGRFLQSIAQAKSLTDDWRSAPPANGLLLVQGDELVQTKDWRILYDWAMHSSCAALVIAPLASNIEGWQMLPISLDWQLTSATAPTQSVGLAAVVASEINQAITGFTGSADGSHHQTADVIHTRYVRKHSNSGLLAVTTLPLWSLNLLDHGDLLVEWFNWFIEHAGVAEQTKLIQTETVDFVPEKQDLVVLLLIYAAQGLTTQALVEHPAVNMLFDTQSLDISFRGSILQQYGFIHELVLTEKGLSTLQASNYWAYADLLTEQLRTGAHE